MEIEKKIKSFKDANPELKQITVRLPKEHYSRVVKYAKENDIKEGIASRLLLQCAIEELDKDGNQIGNDANEALKKEVDSMREEIDTFKQELASMKGRMELLAEESVKESMSCNKNAKVISKPEKS